MYTTADYAAVRQQKNKRIALLAIPCALLLAGIVVSFIVRMEWLTSLLSVVLGIVLMFCLDMFILPLHRYENHLAHALGGKTRQITGCLKEMEVNLVDKEGLPFYPVIININKMENEEDDRLFYWDAHTPRPDWQPGQKLTLTSYDKRITAWQAE